jgi:hypothetical protein
VSDTPRTDKLYEEVWRFTNETDAVDALISMRDLCRELERENAALREAKDAYFKHNNILVQLMTEEQKKKALEILMSRPKEAQP